MKEYQTYKTAKRHAEALGLIEAEYGSQNPACHNGKAFYCYWNKTGNRHDKPIILANYNFDSKGKAI